MSNQYYTPGPTPPGQPTVTIQHYDHPYPYPYSTPPQPVPQYTFGDIHDPVPPQVPTPMSLNGFYPNNIQFHESSVFPVPPPVQQPKENESGEAPTTQSKRHHYSKEQTDYLLLDLQRIHIRPRRGNWRFLRLSELRFSRFLLGSRIG